MADQLLLFEESLEGKLLREVRELKESLNKIRKGQFAKIGELRKMYQSIHDDLEIIKSGLCKGELQQKSTCEIFEMALM
jgi:hypothetical protein